MPQLPPEASGQTSTPQLMIRCNDLVVPPLSASPSWRTEDTVESYRTALSLQPSCYESPLNIHNFGLQNLAGPAPIIAVMGPTGAGKSTFIKVATGSDEVQIGDSLHSCTRESQVIRCRNATRNCDVILVDTPGFDDTVRSDMEILRGIADWLEKTYESGIRLSGILYLHRITDNRMTNTLLRNLDLFRKLCGDDVFSNIRFVTTSWDLLKEMDDGERAEEELCTKYWKPFLESGSQTHRFLYTCSSAWKIINSLPMERKVVTQIQREMVDQHKSLSRTAAGRSLFAWASQALKELIAHLEHLARKLASLSSPDKLQKANEKRLTEAKEELHRIESLRSLPPRLARLRRRSTSKTARSSDESTLSPNSEAWQPLSPFVSHQSGEHDGHLQRPIKRQQTVNSDFTHLAAPTIGQSNICDIPDTDSLFEVAIGADPSATGTLTYTIQTLKFARAAVTGLPAPGLAAAVGAALRIAELLNEMRETDRSLVVLINNVGRFIKTICRQDSVQSYPKAVTDAIDEFNIHLRRIEKLAQKLRKGSRIRRCALEPDERRVVIDCNDAIKLALHSLGIRIGLATAAQNEDILLKLNNLQSLVTRMVNNYETKRNQTF